MISSSSLPFPLKVGVVIFLLAIFSIHLLSNHPPSQSYQAISHRPSFVEIVQDTQIDDPYDLTPLKELCDGTEWTNGIIISCGFPSGEISEVRNTVLNCVRYAIAAGAALLVPQIYSLFDDINTKETLAKPEPFTHYFDLAHFLTTLTTSCPQMTLYQSLNDLWAFPTVATPLTLDPTTLFTSFKLDTLDAHPSDWPTNFHHWLHMSRPDYTPDLPVLVRIREPFLNFPTDYDPPEFVQVFGRILQYRADIRALAAQIHQILSETIPTLGARTKISNDTYLGAHLRKMPDIPAKVGEAATEWTSLATQAKLYAGTATSHGLTTVYVAAARVGDILALDTIAEKNRLRIVSKEKLLPEGALDGLTWDQRAIVDFEVLLKASGFVGVCSSLFAWSVAMRRHVVCGDEDPAVVEQGAGADETGVGFGDGCTRLFGARDETFRQGVWP